MNEAQKISGTMAKKSEHCKLYQEQILETDNSLNAFGVCPKCLWDIADHNHAHAPQGDIICSHRILPYFYFYFVYDTFLI